jgi:hypothetical protein
MPAVNWQTSLSTTAQHAVFVRSARQFNTDQKLTIMPAAHCKPWLRSNLGLALQHSVGQPNSGAVSNW